MKKFLSLVLALVMVFSLAAVANADAVQEITYSLYSQPDGIDPGITNNSFASYVLANAFEGLMTYDPATQSLVCGEAESYTVSEDGLVYTFNLRPDLKWSDGSAHTAADYVYAIQRILDPNTGAQYVDLVTAYIAGADAYYAGETSDMADVGIKALDDSTLEITLNNPTSYFVDVLSMWTFDPVQEATIAANGDAWTSSPETYVSNGPFYVTEMKLGESITLSKNPNYWDADAVTLEKVTFRYITDNSTALMAYESGEIDGMNAVPASDYARLKANDDGFVVTPSYGTTYWNFNCTAEPFDNVLVRKAFNLAIDRYTLINDVLQADAEPAFSFIAPGYSVDGVDYTDNRSDFGLSDEADVEAAQAALAEAGYPNGEGFPEITLYYYSSDTVALVAQALANMLETNLNISVKIENADWAVFYADVLAGNYQLCAMGWSADYLHPMTFLPLAKTDDANNLSGWGNAEYDALVEKVAVCTDPVEALEYVQAADEIAGNEYVFLNLYFKNGTSLMHSNIQGYYINPSAIMYLKLTSVVE